MVDENGNASAGGTLFQYSLCRVVLMVLSRRGSGGSLSQLSVLALSSRFDGRRPPRRRCFAGRLSVLALSSRFDGQCPKPITHD